MSMSGSNLSSPVITPAQLAVVSTPFVIARYAALNKLREETELKKKQNSSRHDSYFDERDKIRDKIREETHDRVLMEKWARKRTGGIEYRMMGRGSHDILDKYMEERMDEERRRLDAKYDELFDDIRAVEESLNAELRQFTNNANQKLHEFSDKLQKLKGYDFVLYHDGNAAPFFYATNAIDVSTHITSLLNGEAIENIPPVREVVFKGVFIDLEKIKNAVPITEDQLERMTNEVWGNTSWGKRSGLVEYIAYKEYHLKRVENNETWSPIDPGIQRESIYKCKDELESLDNALNDRINSFKTQLVQQARAYVEQTHTEKGYDYVLPVNEVVYADEKFDITEDVVAILNHRSLTSSTYTGVAASKIAFLSFSDIQQKCTLTTNGHALSWEELMPKIKTILRDLQKSKGFDFVINDRLFWCANPKFNITNDVLAVLNSGKI